MPPKRVRPWSARALAPILILFACGGEDERRAPALPPGFGTGTGTASSSAGEPETEDEVPAECAGFTPGSGSGSATTSDGDDDAAVTRFDVGVPETPFEFPLDCEQAAARETNLGCEFWAVDLPNDPAGTDFSPPAADQQFAVVVANPSGLEDAIVEAFVPGEPFAFASTPVPPGETRTIELPPLSIEPLTSTSTGEAYRIVSDRPITAYQFNPLDNTTPVYSNDASLLLPSHALGTDYMAVSGDAVMLGMSPYDPTPINAGAYVSVVATVDGTRVELSPTAKLVGTLPDPLVLDRGRVATIVSSASAPPGNLSGTRIHADHPVAVFSGNVATAVPADDLRCCADHLEHQLVPYTAWGTAYAVAPPAHAGPGNGDDPAEIRMIGAFDDTELVYCPSRPRGAPTHLDAGEVVTFETKRPFAVRSRDPGHAFSIAQFLESDEAIDPRGVGDPALLVVPAAAQFQPRYVFAIPFGYAENLVTLIRTSEHAVLLDQRPIEDEAWTALATLDGVRYEYAHRRVDEGMHLVESRGPVGLTVLGYDEAVSYAFPGGAGVRVIAIPPVQG